MQIEMSRPLIDQALLQAVGVCFNAGRHRFQMPLGAILLGRVAVPVGGQARNVEVGPQDVPLVAQGLVHLEGGLDVPETRRRIANQEADGPQLVKKLGFDRSLPAVAQVEGLAVESERFPVRKRGRGTVPCVNQILDGLVGDIAPGKVIRQRVAVLRERRRGHLLERLPDQTVQVLPARDQQALICHLLEDGVPEGVLQVGEEPSLLDKLGERERLHMSLNVLRDLGNSRENFHAEGPTEDGTDL